MKTTFLRLLKAEDKEAALREAVGAVRSGGAGQDTVFSLEPGKFSQVPNSPFAYWVDDEIRELFTKFPPFESEGRTVRVGLQTGDDFRFVRAWWEVPAERRLDAGNGPDWRADLPAFQAWCRKSTHEGRYWAPFAKGGEYSPYYADIHLVVNWKDEGEEMKAFSGSVIRNESFYFRPGVTWSYRTHRLCLQELPASTVISVRGSGAYLPRFSDFPIILAYGNTMTADSLIKIAMGRGGHPQFDQGDLKTLPILNRNISDISIYCLDILKRIKKINSKSENCLGNFSGLFQKIDADILQIKESQKRIEEYYRVNIENHAEFKIEVIQSDFQPSDEEIQYVFGQLFGRFDIRIAKDPSLAPALPDPFDPLPVCPPAMLVGTDGLPARRDDIASEAWLRARPNAISLPPEPARSGKISAAEYPIDIPWDGILVDDPDDPRDVLARLRSALRFLHGEGADEKEREFRAELGVNDLRDYLGKPGGFFDAHLKRYSKSRRKAPIYWPLQSADGRYTLWLYYPRLTADTLYACSNILEEKLKLERRKLETARQDLARSESKADRLRTEELAGFTAALAEMKEELDRVAGLPYKPDLDDGVQITASPLWRLFSASFLAEGARGDLEEAHYRGLRLGPYRLCRVARPGQGEVPAGTAPSPLPTGSKTSANGSLRRPKRRGEKRTGKKEVVVESELELETDED